MRGKNVALGSAVRPQLLLESAVHRSDWPGASHLRVGGVVRAALRGHDECHDERRRARPPPGAMDQHASFFDSGLNKDVDRADGGQNVGVLPGKNTRRASVFEERENVD